MLSPASRNLLQVWRRAVLQITGTSAKSLGSKQGRRRQTRLKLEKASWWINHYGPEGCSKRKF